MRAMLLIYGLFTALAAVLHTALWPLIKVLVRLVRWGWRHARIAHTQLRVAELEAAIDSSRQHVAEINFGLPYWEAELLALRDELRSLQSVSGDGGH